MKDSCSRTKGFVAALCAAGMLALGALMPQAAHAANSCNTFIALDYPLEPPNTYNSPQDIIRVSLSLGAGPITGGTQVTINKIRFDMDCNSDDPLGIGCTDEGAIVEYMGDSSIMTTCVGIGFATNPAHPGGPNPNQLEFVASPAFTIPANTADFCAIEFDVRILTQSVDGSPDRIEQVAGFDASENDAECDNDLMSGGSQSGSVLVCPVCNDNNECTVDTCNETTGQCEFSPPKVCAEGDDGTDGSLCTPVSCNEATGLCVDGAAKVCAEGDDGTDGSLCTPVACAPATGLCADGAAKVCAEGDDGTDGSLCTPVACAPATGLCTDGAAKVCAEGDDGTDGSLCTPVACAPATGLCTDGAAKVCAEGDDGTDGDLCTPVACAPATGLCTDGAAKICVEGDDGTDGNLCTPVACSPGTGLCTDGAAKVCAEGDDGTDGSLCTPVACAPGTGLCTDGAAKVCAEGDDGTDGSLCTPVACAPGTGLCTDGAAKVCAEGDDGTDGSLCTPVACAPGTGLCTDGAAKVCAEGDDGTDGSLCTPVACAPGTGLCTDGAAKVCAEGDPGTDGNFCTPASCDPASGNCVEGPPTVCPGDDNLCAPEVCNPANGNCEPGTPVTCPDDGDPCTSEVCNPDTGMCETQSGAGGFGLLVRLNGKLGNQSQIFADIGANDPGGFFNLGYNVFAGDGTSMSAHKVHIGANTSIFNLNANIFNGGPGSSVRGTTSPVTLPLTDPFCPIPALSCDSANPVTIPGGPGALSPGNYGRLWVRLGESIVLNGPGVFNFCSIHSTWFGRIVVAGAGQTTINVMGDFRLANGGFLGRDSAGPLPVINVGGTFVRIGARTEIKAILSAPNATMRLGRHASLQGNFCVDTLRSDKGVTIECPPATGPTTTTTSTTPVSTTTTTTIGSASGAFLE